jgi:hypothetical protein
MQAAAKSEAASVFVQLAVDADLDDVEVEELRQLAKQLSGVTLKSIDGSLRAAAKRHSAQRASETRTRQDAERRDPRPQIGAPYEDWPWLPVMDTLNEVIGAAPADVPPLRDIDGVVTRARLQPVSNLHVFTHNEENVDE